MARIRSIKPEFFTSEQIVECSTSARLLFIGLWCFSDDAGRHTASPKRLMMEVFPGDGCKEKNVENWISELIHVGLVIEYSSQGQSYWQVTGWDKHQRIDRPTIRWPGPFDEGSTITRRGIDEPSPPERKGEERRGEEWKGEEWNGKASPISLMIFPEPLNTPQFSDAWNRWKAYRTEKKKSLTKSTIEQQLRKLADFGHDAAIASIMRSIEKGWTGLFPSSETESKNVASTEPPPLKFMN